MSILQDVNNLDMLQVNYLITKAHHRDSLHPSLFPMWARMEFGCEMLRFVCTALKNPISPGHAPSMVEKLAIMPFVTWKMISPERRGSPFQTDAISLCERKALRRLRQINSGVGASLRCSPINKRHLRWAQQQAINITPCNNWALYTSRSVPCLILLS